MPRPRRSIVPGAALLVLLVGCSGSDADVDPGPSPSASATRSPSGLAALSADELYERSAAALADEDAFHVVGTACEDGECTDIDLTYGESDTYGSVGYNGMPMEVRIVEDQMYARGDAELWRTLGDAEDGSLDGLADRWVLIGATEGVEGIEELQRDALLDSFTPEGEVELVEGRRIGGRETIGLRDEEGTLFVDAETALPLVLSSAEGMRGEMAIVYEVEPSPGAPPADEVLDLSGEAVA